MLEAAIIVFIILAVIGTVAKQTGKATKKRASSGRTSAPNTTPAERSAKRPEPKPSVNDEIAWLKGEWKRVFDAKEAGNALGPEFPAWYFDEVTESQLKKLESLEISVSGGQLTKGQTSDLIGLYSPIAEDDQEVLKFFKVDHKGMSETRGRHTVRGLLSEPERLEQWENRPATPVQKEFYRFFGMKVPTGLTVKEATKVIAEVSNRDDEEHDEKLEQWAAYEDIITDLSDKEMLREDFEIKKPSLSLIREAIGALVKEGEQLAGLDSYTVADKIKELKPEMEVEAA